MKEGVKHPLEIVPQSVLSRHLFNYLGTLVPIIRKLVQRLRRTLSPSNSREHKSNTQLAEMHLVTRQ